MSAPKAPRRVPAQAAAVSTSSTSGGPVPAHPATDRPSAGDGTRPLIEPVEMSAPKAPRRVPAQLRRSRQARPAVGQSPTLRPTGRQAVSRRRDTTAHRARRDVRSEGTSASPSARCGGLDKLDQRWASPRPPCDRQADSRQPETGHDHRPSSLSRCPHRRHLGESQRRLRRSRQARPAVGQSPPTLRPTGRPSAGDGTRPPPIEPVEMSAAKAPRRVPAHAAAVSTSSTSGGPVPAHPATDRPSAGDGTRPRPSSPSRCPRRRHLGESQRTLRRSRQARPAVGQSQPSAGPVFSSPGRSAPRGCSGRHGRRCARPRRPCRRSTRGASAAAPDRRRRSRDGWPRRPGTRRR